jgi:hypothetical protein
MDRPLALDYPLKLGRRWSPPARSNDSLLIGIGALSAISGYRGVAAVAGMHANLAARR